MKKSFAAKSFAAKSFASGAWAGTGAAVVVTVRGFRRYRIVGANKKTHRITGSRGD